MEIVLSPDPILREVCKPIPEIDKDIKKLAKQMAKDMYKNGGVGLAAPQVGVAKRMVVIDCNIDAHAKKNPITLINPEIIEHSEGTWKGDEGCLSVPGISCEIPRYKTVTVKYTDLDGNEQLIDGNYKVDELLCRCLQHELDHLDGITMFERLGPVDRIDALKRYKEALESGARPGDTSR